MFQRVNTTVVWESKNFIEEAVTGNGKFRNTNCLLCQISGPGQDGVHPSPSGSEKKVGMECRRSKKRVIDTPYVIKVPKKEMS